MSQSDALFRQILDRSAQGVLVHRQGPPLYANQALADLLGFATVTEVMAIPSVFDYFSPDARERAAGMHARRLEGENMANVFNHPMKTHDGRTIWIESRLAVVDWEGEPAVQVALSDITERHRLEMLKDEFVSTVSHELRTPLTAISGALSILASGMSGPTTPKQDRMLEIARSNAERLTRLINDILDTQIAARSPAPSEAQSVGEVIAETLRMNQPVLAQGGLRIAIRDESGGAAVRIEREVLIRILTNLLSNAARHASGTDVDVAAVVDDGRVVLSVADNGPGVPEDLRERLFTRFGRGRDSQSRGSGLGLYICRQLVAARGGTIDYAPENTGSRFTVVLPLA